MPSCPDDMWSRPFSSPEADVHILIMYCFTFNACVCYNKRGLLTFAIGGLWINFCCNYASTLLASKMSEVYSVNCFEAVLKPSIFKCTLA